MRVSLWFLFFPCALGCGRALFDTLLTPCSSTPLAVAPITPHMSLPPNPNPFQTLLPMCLLFAGGVAPLVACLCEPWST